MAAGQSSAVGKNRYERRTVTNPGRSISLPMHAARRITPRIIRIVIFIVGDLFGKCSRKVGFCREQIPQEAIFASEKVFLIIPVFAFTMHFRQLSEEGG
jgi:hypothetical protein